MRPDIPVSECSRIESEFNIPEKVRKTIYREEEEEEGGKGRGRRRRNGQVGRYLEISILGRSAKADRFIRVSRDKKNDDARLEAARNMQR